MRVFIVPDIHMKIEMIKRAEKEFAESGLDKMVWLGDLPDDWDKQNDLGLYSDTFYLVCEILRKYPDSLFCIGNHDISYYWNKTESGFSPMAREICARGLMDIMKILGENCQFIHRVDNVLFSHAGLTRYFYEDNFEGMEWDNDTVLDEINRMGANILWTSISPIWARPQEAHYIMQSYPEGYLQVIGHTPVERPMMTGNFLTLDTFSTYQDGSPIGDQKFVWVDTVTKEWGYVEELKV